MRLYNDEKPYIIESSAGMLISPSDGSHIGSAGGQETTMQAIIDTFLNGKKEAVRAAIAEVKTSQEVLAIMNACMIAAKKHKVKMAHHDGIRLVSFTKCKRYADNLGTLEYAFTYRHHRNI